MNIDSPDALQVDCTFPETIQGVISYAAVIKGIIAPMGRNDSEFSDIDSIVLKVRGGTITAADALLKLSGIPEHKQDYN